MCFELFLEEVIMTGNNVVLATGTLSPDEVKQLAFDFGQHPIGQHVCVQSESDGRVFVISKGILPVEVERTLLSQCLQQQCKPAKEDNGLGKLGWGSVLTMVK